VDAFAATRLAIGAGFLLAAAASDVRQRRVRDPLWVLLGSAGIGIAAVELAFRNEGLAAWSLLGSAAILFYAVFYGEPLVDEEGMHLRPLRIGGFLLAAALIAFSIGLVATAPSPVSQGTIELLSIPVMVVLYQLFYRVRLLHGGADAKGLIALTLLVPMYPSADPFPLLTLDPRVQSAVRAAFPFSLVVWVDAAILTLGVPLALLAYNAARGDLRLPQAFLGYRARIDPLPRHVWLMERITDKGDHVLVLFPRRGTDPASDVARLRAAGIERAWVQPQIPFMVPLLAGLLLAFLLGNVLAGIVGLAGQ